MTTDVIYALLYFVWLVFGNTQLLMWVAGIVAGLFMVSRLFSAFLDWFEARL